VDDSGHRGGIVEGGDHALVGRWVQSAGPAVFFGGGGGRVRKAVERAQTETARSCERASEQATTAGAQPELGRSWVEKSAASETGER
jgi:hypothetical protein